MKRIKHHLRLMFVWMIILSVCFSNGTMVLSAKEISHEQVMDNETVSGGDIEVAKEVDSINKDVIENLVSLFEKLPSAADIMGMESEALDVVYLQAMEAMDAFDALSNEECDYFIENYSQLYNAVMEELAGKLASLNQGGTETWSLLPLREEKAYLVVGNHDDIDISAVPLELILENLMDSNGNPIEIDKNAKIAWCYCKDLDGSTITDDYYLIEDGGNINLSVYEDYDRYTLEMIVGDGNQLNPENVRYRITVYLSDEVSGLRTYELYTQDEDGTRHRIVPSDQYVTSTTMSGITSASRIFIVPDHVDGQEYYIGINDPIDEHPFVQCDVMDYADYIGFMMGQSYGFEYEYTNLADKFINVDMTKVDAGYKNNWNLPEVTDDSYDITKTFALVYKDTASGTPLSMELITFTVTNTMPLFEEDAFDANDSTSVMLTSTSHVSINEIKGPFELTADDVSQIRRVILKEGYSADAEYRYALYAKSPIWDNANDHVVKATNGWYDSLDSATEAVDISDQLLPKSNATGEIGYKANYNIADGGVPITIFFDDGAIYKFLIVFQDYDKNADLSYVREFTEKPIIGEADPWIRVVGAADASGNSYETYVIENGKSLNMDTYYGYGYQTVLIYDADADMASIKPEFWYANTERVYAVDENTNDRIDTNHIRDFVNENQQYTGIIIDKTGEPNERNYWVTFKKLNNSGAELYVYGPDTQREVILDKYFEFKHDILIANIGNEELKNISVELENAKNVKLDPYWTVGGEGNNVLAPFTTITSDAEYGELDNLAKIRLLPDGDGDGDVEGTLVIKADGQDDVRITLHGKAENPEIITEKLDEAVKYVPYQHIIATDSIHSDWIDTKFSIVEGEDALPEGITLNHDTGEIYGVPKVTGSYTFTIEAQFLVDEQDDYFKPYQKEFELVVKPNTDENVYLASDKNENSANLDDGYTIKQHIGTQTGEYSFELETIEDTEFTSYGHYDEFKALWLNGEKLDEGVDYDSDSGSTKITIRSQTFENKADRDGTNTIAMEFRNEDNEVNRTSQNFTIENKKDNTQDDGTSDDEDNTQDDGTGDDEDNTQDDNAGDDEDNTQDDSTGDDEDNTQDDNVSADQENNPNENVSDNQSNSSNINQEVPTITLVGILTDSNGDALGDKVIEIHSVVQSGRTDGNGSVQFNNVEFGNHTIFVKDENGNITAQKGFNIIAGSPLVLREDEIVAVNGATFTLKMKLDGNVLTFLSVENGNQSAAAVLSPKTGDDSNLALWCVLMLISLGGFIVAVSSRKERS